MRVAVARSRHARRARSGDIPVEPDTEYVDASYTGGASDGSQAAPWTTIQAGIDAALPDAIVAVAAGSYVEDLVVQGKSLRLWGKCPALVEIVGTGAALAALFLRSGASGSEVRRLTLSGEAHGVAISGAEDVLADELRVFDNADRGVAAVNDEGATSLVVKGSLLEQNNVTGLFVEGATVSVEASVVRESSGHAIDAQPDTSIAVVGSLLERNQEVSVYVSGADATIERTVVRDTSTDAQGFLGRGITAQVDPATRARSSLTVMRSLLERNHTTGVLVHGAAATIEATVVRDTSTDALGFLGVGINAQVDPLMTTPASLTVARSLLERNHEAGVIISGADAMVESVAVRNTLPNAKGRFGRAIQVQVLPATGAPASATLRTSLFDRSIEVGALISGPATADIEACHIRDTAASDTGFLGDGLVVWLDDGPVSVTVTATLIEHSERAAVSNFGAAMALGSSLLLCQAFDIGAESWRGSPAIFDDRGGVMCGCSEAALGCKAKSYALEPPEPP